MAFLRKRDYFTIIRERDLDVVLKELSQTTAQSPTLIRQEKELDVQKIVESHIRHRYDVRKIFTDINTFVLATQYQVGDLIEYSVTAYVSADSYVDTNRVSFSQTVASVLQDNIYEANQAVSAGETPATDPAKWTYITQNYTLYEVIQATVSNLPDTAFAYTANNYTGNHDQIKGWDKSNSLFFKRNSTQIEIYYSAADRTASTNSIGLIDFTKPAKKFPDNRPIETGSDTENAISGDLSFIGFIPDLTEWSAVPSNYFLKQDNRDRVIKKILIDLIVFELHKLINPRNIPDLRLDAKEDSIKMLRDISSGRIEVDLPIYFDTDRGQRISYGSEPQQNHSY